MSLKKKKKQEETQKPDAGYIFGSILRFVYNVFVKYSGLWIAAIYTIFGLILWVSSGLNPFKLDSEGHTLYLVFFFIFAFVSLVITIKKLIINPTKNIVKGFKSPAWQKKDTKDEPANATPTYQTTEEYYNIPTHTNLTRKDIRQAKAAKAQLAKQTKKIPQLKRSVDYNEQPASTLPPPPTPNFQSPPPYSPYSNSPWAQTTYSSPKEEPQIYLSILEANTLIHEYSDRFEVYRLINGNAVREKVEFKNKPY